MKEGEKGGEQKGRGILKVTFSVLTKGDGERERRRVGKAGISAKYCNVYRGFNGSGKEGGGELLVSPVTPVYRGDHYWGSTLLSSASFA